MKEFSKRVIRAMVRIWIWGAIFGGAVVLAELAASLFSDSYMTTVDLASWLSYIGAPMSCGILGYMLKSAFENREKIKKGGEYSPPNIEEDKP